MIRRWRRLSPRERRDVVEAAACLALVRATGVVPFRWLAPLFGRSQPSTHAEPMIDQRGRDAALGIGLAVVRAGGRLPWHSSCLVRALAAHAMLRRRGLPSVLHLGVRAGVPGLSAHAWLRCGGIDIVGAEEAVQFTPIAAFRS